MSERLVILGAGGHGREMLDIVEAVNGAPPTFEFLGFVDDGDGPWPEVDARRALVLGDTSGLAGLDASYVIGMGDPQARTVVDRAATAAGLQPATLLHPSSSVGGDVRLGSGLVMAAGSRITTNVEIGRHVHVNLNATISHDCRIGDFTTLSPGCHVTGAVTIGARVTLGVGAVVHPGLSVGDDAVIGAGAAVVEDVPPGATVAGVPARPLSES